ncbi:MAG TPA: hypothetical protein VKB10_09940 [Gaiellaceae bacterium]|nr:hypothetical protein [Gaiellaceae bacterium]
MALRLFLAVSLGVIATAAATNAGSPRAGAFRVLAHVAAGGGYSADVVGERHYAYLSSRKGLGADCPAQGVRAYDLSQPRRPRHLSTFARIPGTWTEKTIVRRVKTRGFDGVLAAVSVQACTDGFGGFVVYDVTRPARPRELARVRTEPRGSHEIWLATANGKAWVYTAEAATETSLAPNAFGFHIYEVTEPSTPVEVGNWSACRDLHLCSALGTTNFLVHSVRTNAAATRAYLSYWDLGTVILDIGQPAQPRYLGRTAPGQGHVHSSWPMGDPRLMLETHELEHGRPAVWDVRDPAHPVRLGTIRLPAALRPGGGFTRTLADSVHDPKSAGRSAYFSWYGQGVALFDLKRPRRPRFIARFRPPPERDRHGLLCPGHSCTAVWGVFVMRDYVLASDMSSGLWVLSRPR